VKPLSEQEVAVLTVERDAEFSAMETSRIAQDQAAADVHTHYERFREIDERLRADALLKVNVDSSWAN